MKYGVRVPRNCEEAIELDTANNNHLWRDALDREMKNVGIAFHVLAKGQQAPVEWHKFSVHVVFDVKMSGERRARFICGGYSLDQGSPSTSI